MPQVVGIRFKPVTKVYYFDPDRYQDIQLDDRVVVETARGTEMGRVAMPIHEVPQSEIKGKLKRVLRKATPVDLVQSEMYKAQEPEALEKCEELVEKLNLPLKVLQAEYSFDGSRLVFSFVADKRVDFRKLVRELNRFFQTRIEMKQVGARDETKILDGYGRCGRRFCCSSWLTEFHPVSIRMAKKQGLPLAPSEISGLCGRLLCCLAYEDDFYTEMKKILPNVGTRVQTEQGAIGKVRGVNVIKETVILDIPGSDTYLELEADKVEVVKEDESNSKDQSAQSKRSRSSSNRSKKKKRRRRRKKKNK